MIRELDEVDEVGDSYEVCLMILSATSKLMTGTFRVTGTHLTRNNLLCEADLNPCSLVL